MDGTFGELSKFRESDKSPKHKFESISRYSPLPVSWWLYDRLTSWSITQEVAGLGQLGFFYKNVVAKYLGKTQLYFKCCVLWIMCLNF